MTPCPHCGVPHDVNLRNSHDRVWCQHCDNWFLVIHHTGTATELRPCDPPASWPKESRRKGRSASDTPP